MGFNHIPAFAVSNQASLASNDRALKPQLPLKSNTVLMAPTGRDDHGNPVVAQPLYRRCVLRTDLFVRSK
jgi:hypothetical protein